MDSKPDSISGLNCEIWVIIEQQLLKFENAWREQAIPDIGRFSELPESAQAWHIDSDNEQPRPQLRLLAELIKIDLEHRWKRGIQQRSEAYFAAHPESELAGLRTEIIEAELDARRIVQHLPEASELQDRFPSQSGKWIAFVRRLESISASSSSEFGSRPASHETVVGDFANSTAIQQLSEIGKLQSGARIDRYILREQIGHGTFSVVWRAIDNRLKRDVAIKILRPDKIEHDHSIVVRLLREGRAAAAIDHPGVVKIYEVSSNEDCTFIVEQFIDGPNLKKIIENGIPSARRCIEIIRDVCLALQAAHACGVVHRDIKPANILLSGNETPMLVDFGLAYLDQFADSTLTQQGELLGTPAYMSPEQAQGRHQLVDARSDIYSLGAVLYHTLTGELPFGGSMLSVLDEVVHKTPSRAKLAQHAMDRDLETMVLKCLEKDPGDRYQSAAELADDLQRHLDGQPIQARPVGLMERSWKWSKRHPRWAGAIVGIFLLVAFLSGTLLQLRSVSAQRIRAEAAEQRSQQLLRESTKAAGRLAMQRGKMAEAVRHFRRAQNLMAEDSDPALKLDLIESLVATRNIDEAKQELEQIVIHALPEELRGHGCLLNAQLELETGEPNAAARLFQVASNEVLPPGRAAYVRAMLAERSPDAVRELEASLEIEPLSHLPRRMLVTLLLSLAEFEEAGNQLKIAQQLFPDDVDFQLLEAIVLASSDQPENAARQIDRLQLPRRQKQNWKSFCGAVHNLRVTYNHRRNEFGFNQASLSQLSEMYTDVAGPCLSGRGFVFPPRIAIRFANLFDCLEKFSQGTVDLTATWPELTALVEIHPEGSLIILDLSTLLNQDRIAEALQRCRQLKSAKGFVRDSDEMLAEIQFTSAMFQFTRALPRERMEIMKNGTDAVLKFEEFPYLVERYSQNANYCRILNIFLIESFKARIASEQLVKKWLTRLKQNPESDKNQTIWFEAVIANRANRPFDALNSLAELANNAGRANSQMDENFLKLAASMLEAIKIVLKENLEKSETIEFGKPNRRLPSPDSHD